MAVTQVEPTPTPPEPPKPDSVTYAGTGGTATYREKPNA